MGANTRIGWTHNTKGEPGHTLNAWIGCEEATLPDGTQHQGCTGCYAREGYGTRYHVDWGAPHLGGLRRPKAESGWQDFYALARRAAGLGRFERVFTMSLGDVLEEIAVPPSVDWEGWPTSRAEEQPPAGEEVPLYAHPDPRVHGPERARLIVHARAVAETVERERTRLWDTWRALALVCGRCGGTRWPGGWEAAHRLGLRVCSGTACKGLVITGDVPVGGFVPLMLTKRPERAHLVPEDVRGLCAMGTSISDQRSAEAMVPRLLKVPGFALYFVSAEPLVAPVDFWESWLRLPQDAHTRSQHVGSALGWVITGGESGRGDKPRPFHVEHAAALLKQAREHGVPAFMKQMGSLPVLAEAEFRARSGLGSRLWTNEKNARRAPNGTVALAFTGKGEDATEWAHLFGGHPSKAAQLQQVPSIHTMLGVR